MLSRYDIDDRFARMWVRSRADAGKSQEYVAKAMGVSKKTVQNWEAGLSCPNQRQGFEWFQVLGLQPLPYYLELLYGEFEGLTEKSSDDDISEAFCALFRSLPSDTKRKLLYVATGTHGSSPSAVLELLVAHLHTPLRARIAIAEQIITSYEMAAQMGQIVEPGHIQPNMELLGLAKTLAKESVINGGQKYTTAKEE